jgi:hypothetical protein
MHLTVGIFLFMINLISPRKCFTLKLQMNKTFSLRIINTYLSCVLLWESLIFLIFKCSQY